MTHNARHEVLDRSARVLELLFQRCLQLRAHLLRNLLRTFGNRFVGLAEELDHLRVEALDAGLQDALLAERPLVDEGVRHRARRVAEATAGVDRGNAFGDSFLERRLDRLVNPLVSDLPPFLAAEDGAGSGFMIAQYTAASLAADNRRLAAPASLDGGVTSGLQEDHLSHATPAALKLLKIIDNAELIVAIELLAAAQSYELQRESLARAAQTDAVYQMVRARIAHYRDDRPLGADIQTARDLLRAPLPEAA